MRLVMTVARVIAGANNKPKKFKSYEDKKPKYSRVKLE